MSSGKGGYLEGSGDLIIHHASNTETVKPFKIFMGYYGKGTWQSVDDHIVTGLYYSGTIDIGGTATDAKGHIVIHDDNRPEKLVIEND